MKLIKSLNQIRAKAKKLENHKNPEIKELAKIVLSMSSTLVILEAQRNHWLSSFAESKNLLKEVKKTLKKEEALIEMALNSFKK